MKKQLGFTIVELMIGLSLGLVLAMGVAAIYVQTGKSRTMQASLNRLSDDGHYALETYKRMITQSGFRVWNSTGDSKGDMKLATAFPASTPFSASETLRVDAVSGVSLLNIRFKGDSSKNVIRCDKNEGNDTNYPFLTTESTTYSFSLYKSGTSLMCKRYGVDASAQSVVDNVVDYSLSFGEDTSTTPDQIVDEYKATIAAGKWVNVYAVRMCLVLKTDSTTVLDQAMSYQKCDGTSATATDKAMYRTFVSTMQLRNHFE